MIVTEQNHEIRGLRVTAVRPEYGAGLRIAVPRITGAVCACLCTVTSRYVTLCANCAAHRRVWCPVVVPVSSSTRTAVGCVQCCSDLPI